MAASRAEARVDGVEILERQAFADGTRFGDAGPYEKLHGRVRFALDPIAAANAPIADLALAPRDARGLVTFSADFLMLRPATGGGNGTLLYEVNNRGNIGILGQLDDAPPSNDPATAADAGNGFLFRQGFTLLWSAWAADVATRPDERRMVLHPPVATEHGEPITGPVAYEAIVDAPTPTTEFTGMLGTAYPFAHEAAPDAALTQRDRPEGERHPIARSAWSFVPPASGDTPTRIRLDGGFQPGRIYELTYTARDPVILALGMAGIRDLLSYLRTHRLAGGPVPQHSLIFGISQSGRLIQTMLLRGLHVDEAGQPPFDGAFIHVAGGGKGGFDYRFAMPTRHFSVLQDHIYPTDYFPFATTPARDPVSGVTASVLDRARQLRSVPKLFYVNDSTEYWNRSASLIGTDPAGTHDVPPAPEARIYLIAGAQHYVGRQRDRGLYTNCVDTLDHYRVLRALLVALQAWVRDGTEPPPSAYPRLADGTLVTVAAYEAMFPNIPGFLLPEGALRPPRLDFGPRFASARIADIVPPIPGPPFETLVPRPDQDGLDQGGIEMPEMRVPLGTRTGFNTSRRGGRLSLGDGTLGRLVRAVPHAPRPSGAQARDPRPSLQARYAGRGRIYEHGAGRPRSDR